MCFKSNSIRKVYLVLSCLLYLLLLFCVVVVVAVVVFKFNIQRLLIKRLDQSLLQSQVEQLEQELSSARHQAASTERALEMKLSLATDDAAALRSKLSAAHSDTDSLRATIDVLKASAVLHMHD